MFGVKRWCKSELDEMRVNLGMLETRVKQLECPHDGEMEFLAAFFYCYWRRCAKCGKTLEHYETQDEFDAARIAYEQARLDEDKKRLKERQKKAK